MKAVFTTGEVARICMVSAQLVNRWVDEGLLKGYRVPGSRHRRVERESLIAFMKANELPMSGLEIEESKSA